MTTDDREGPSVRPAERSDLPAVRDTLVSSWQEGYDGILDPDALAEATADPAAFYPAERFEGKLGDQRLRVFVAVPDRPRGIATVNWGVDNTHEFVPEGDAQLRSVYVHPDYWGEGIGTELTETAAATLPTAVDELWVECLAENARGDSFYQGLGFEPVDERAIELFGETHRTRIYRRGVA